MRKQKPVIKPIKEVTTKKPSAKKQPVKKGCK
jgi:hypothetical protein